MDPKLDVRREAGPKVQYSRFHVWGGFTPLGGGCRRHNRSGKLTVATRFLGSLHAGWSYSQIGETTSALLLHKFGQLLQDVGIYSPEGE